MPRRFGQFGLKTHAFSTPPPAVVLLFALFLQRGFERGRTTIAGPPDRRSSARPLGLDFISIVLGSTEQTDRAALIGLNGRTDTVDRAFGRSAGRPRRRPHAYRREMKTTKAKRAANAKAKDSRASLPSGSIQQSARQAARLVGGPKLTDNHQPIPDTDTNTNRTPQGFPIAAPRHCCQ